MSPARPLYSMSLRFLPKHVRRLLYFTLTELERVWQVYEDGKEILFHARLKRHRQEEYIQFLTTLELHYGIGCFQDELETAFTHYSSIAASERQAAQLTKLLKHRLNELEKTHAQ